MRRQLTVYTIARGHRPQGEHGATVVEFAVVATIFFLLILGIIEFGWFYFVQHTIHYATREGTRLALVGTQLEDNEGNLMTREASIIRIIRDNASIAVNPNDLLISIYPVGAGYAEPPDWQTMVNAGAGGDYMRVRTRYIFTFVTPLIKPLFPGGAKEIQASTLFRNELF